MAYRWRTRLRVGTSLAGITPTYDAAVVAYNAAQQAAGGSPLSATTLGLLSTLVAGIKADGDWTDLDWLCDLASENQFAARYNIRNPTKFLTAVNAPTFTSGLGYSGDGVSAYLDTGEAPTGTGRNFSLNAASFGVWVNAQGAGAGLQSQVGQGTTSYRASIMSTSTVGNADQLRVNDVTTETLNTSTGTRTGHRAGNRTGVNTKGGFFGAGNSSTMTKTLTSTAASSTVPTAMFLLRNNGTSYGTDRIALFWMGGGASDAAVLRLHARFYAYLSAKGAIYCHAF